MSIQNKLINLFFLTTIANYSLNFLGYELALGKIVIILLLSAAFFFFSFRHKKMYAGRSGYLAIIAVEVIILVDNLYVLFFKIL